MQVKEDKGKGTDNSDVGADDDDDDDDDDMDDGAPRDEDAAGRFEVIGTTTDANGAEEADVVELALVVEFEGRAVEGVAMLRKISDIVFLIRCCIALIFCLERTKCL